MLRKSYNRNQRHRVRHQPLGEVLVDAGLLSSSQIESALQEQRYNPQFLIGEILSLRGWIKQDTADFFVCDWQNILCQRRKQPIGQYFRLAGLLDERQIADILREHHQTGLRFGSVAVLQGLIKERTLDFFLENLSPQELNSSSFSTGYSTGGYQSSQFSNSSNSTRGYQSGQFSTSSNSMKSESFLEEDYYDSDAFDNVSGFTSHSNQKEIDDIETSVIWIG